jgi:hypothetical protein
MSKLTEAIVSLNLATAAELEEMPAPQLHRAERTLWRWYLMARRCKSRLGSHKTADEIVADAQAALAPKEGVLADLKAGERSP